MNNHARITILRQSLRLAHLSLGAAVALLAAAPAAKASPVAVVARGTLNADLRVDWQAAAGSISTTFIPNTPPSPLTVSLTSDLSLDVSLPVVDPSSPPTFTRYDQNSVQGDFSTGGWDGNFAPGDHLLYTGVDNNNVPNFGPINLTFSQPVFGFGTQFQSSISPVPFTAIISVYNAADQLLGTFSQTGFSDNGGNNSAIFLGVADSVGEIKRATLSLTVGSSRDAFAINQLDVLTTPASLAVPEPSTNLLLTVSFGIGCAAFFRQRKKASFRQTITAGSSFIIQ